MELLRSVISHHRVPHANQASALIDAVKAVGGQLVAANPVGMLCFFHPVKFLFKGMIFIGFCVELAVGNVVRRVLHIIREEDLSLATAAVAGLDLLDASDDDEDVNGKGIGYPAMSAAVVAAAARSTLRPPSLQTLLEGTPESATVPYTSSSGADSESKSKCTLFHSFKNALLLESQLPDIVIPLICHEEKWNGRNIIKLLYFFFGNSIITVFVEIV